MAPTTNSHVNGVDVDQLVETINHIKEDGDLAEFEFRAKSTWEKGGESRTEIQGFYGAGQENSSRDEPFVVEGDEPPVLLGGNSAPNAVELTLAALASCLNVGVAYNAAAQGIEIEDMSMELTGELNLEGFLGLNERVRPGYRKIEVNYHINSDASRDELNDLLDHVQRTSPVQDMLSNPVQVEVQLQ